MCPTKSLLQTRRSFVLKHASGRDCSRFNGVFRIRIQQPYRGDGNMAFPRIAFLPDAEPAPHLDKQGAENIAN